MMFRPFKRPVALALEAILSHPGYAPMRAQHLTLLCRETMFPNGLPHHQISHFYSFSNHTPLSQRFFDFRFLNDWEEVQAVVNRLGPELSAMHLEAAYNRIKYLRVRPSMEFMDELTTRAIRLAPTMSARNCAWILHACVRLRYYNAELTETLVKSMLSQEHVKGLDTVEMSSVIFAIGMLQRPYSGFSEEGVSGEESKGETSGVLFSAQQEFVQALIEELVSSDYFERFSVAQLCQVVNGLGRLRCRDERVLASLGKMICKPGLLGEMKFKELSSLWVGVGQMQLESEDALNTMAGESMLPARLVGFKPIELANILHGCGLLRYRNMDFLEAISMEAVRGDRLTGFREKELAMLTYALGLLDFKNEEVVSKLLEEITRKERLEVFTEQGIHNIMFALRRLGCGPDVRMKRLIEEVPEAAGPSSGMTESQLLAMVFGPGKSVQEDKLCETLVKEILNPQRLAQFADDSLSGVLNGLHQIGYTDPNGFEVCLDEVKKRLPTVDTRIISFFAYGLRVNKISDPELLRMFAIEVAKPHRLAEFTHQQLTGTFYSLCMLGLKEPKMMEALLTEIRRPGRLQEISEQGLSNIVTGLAAIGFQPRSIDVTPIFEEITRPERLREFNEHGLVYIAVATAKLKFVPRELAVPPVAELCLPGRLVKLKRSEVAQVVYNLGQLRYRNKRILTPAVKEALKEDRLTNFKRIEFAMIIYGLGLLKVRDNDVAEALAREATKVDVLQLYKNHELTNIVHGFGSMKLGNSAAIERIVAEVLRPERLESYKESDLSTIVYGLGTFSHPAAAPAALELFSVLKARSALGSLSEQHIAQLVLGLGNMGVGKTDDLTSLLKEAVREGRLHLYRPFELAHISYTIGQTKLSDERIVEPLANEILRKGRIPSMSQNELSVISRSLAQTKYKNKHLFDAISKEMMKRFFDDLGDVESKVASG
ncbi:hypothetical protein BSKO_08797 [Bryopsis sp. KO-2023]|nr:hypothetical protein BSKO_08797 [Bryopsis sp. KO-2023]